MKKNKVEGSQGLRDAEGRRQSGSEGRKGHGDVHEAKNILLATGSTARMLPGLQPDADFLLTNVEILNLTQGAEVPGDHRRGRGGRGVWLYV